MLLWVSLNHTERHTGIPGMVAWGGGGGDVLEAVYKRDFQSVLKRLQEVDNTT